MRQDPEITWQLIPVNTKRQLRNTRLKEPVSEDSALLGTTLVQEPIQEVLSLSKTELPHIPSAESTVANKVMETYLDPASILRMEVSARLAVLWAPNLVLEGRPMKTLDPAPTTTETLSTRKEA